MAGHRNYARLAPRAVIIGLLVLAAVLVIVGAVYAAEPAKSLPAFFPGHAAGSTRHHAKHAMLAFVLAVLALIGAWIGSGKKRRRWDS
jgi:hypothetical protein